MIVRGPISRLNSHGLIDPIHKWGLERPLFSSAVWNPAPAVPFFKGAERLCHREKRTEGQMGKIELMFRTRSQVTKVASIELVHVFDPCS
jgi:hypothetical protein